MRNATATVSALLLLATSCARTSGDVSPGDTAHGRAKAPDLGEVMVQVGRRFEIAGRAAVANRFDLAAFEAAELGELFEDDVPSAELPKEGPTSHIHGMADAFLKTNVPDLKRAASMKDPAAFRSAFERCAQACNGCHQVSAKGFIQVPTVPGNAVPVLDPMIDPGKAP